MPGTEAPGLTGDTPSASEVTRVGKIRAPCWTLGPFAFRFLESVEQCEQISMSHTHKLL